MISDITSAVITYGYDCGNFYFKYRIKFFKLSFRATIGEESYGTIEDYDEPLVVSLRAEKINDKMVVRYISFVPYGTESYDISTMTLEELRTLYNSLNI